MSTIIENSSNKFIKNYNLQKIKECARMVDFCDKEIHYLEKRLNEIKTIKKNCKTEIFELCEHKWVIDRSFYDEHTTYICEKCNSYQ